MKSIEVIVPRSLVKFHLPHPEDYGESLVELLNGMVTDVYTSDQGYLFTLTNDYELINFLTRTDSEELVYALENQSIQLRTVQSTDVEMCLKWMNIEVKKGEFKYSLEDVRLYISHAITLHSHLFVVSKDNSPIGLTGYNVINRKGILNLKFFEHTNFTSLDEDNILKILLNHIKQMHAINSFKALVSSEDLTMNRVYLRNNFREGDVQLENHFEHVYQFTKCELTITETEKAVLNEFLSLYPKKLFDLANPDELIDLEHAIDYSLKIYARLILSKQLDQRDEFGDIFIDDDGCLSIEDNLIEKYDEMMQHIYGEDLKIAKNYKDLIFVVLEIINKQIKYYLNLESYKLTDYSSN